MHLFPEITVWIFLSLAIIAIVANKKIWGVFFSLSMVMALFLGILELTGLLTVLAGGAVAYYARNLNGWRQYLLHTILVVWGILLVAHILPGFNNIKVIDNVVTGADSVPFSMSMNIDKPMLIFAFLILLPGMLAKPSSSNAKAIVALSVVSLVTLPVPGYFMGVIKPELSFPSWIVLFALNNLLITCVAEEVFFRGYLQNILSRYGKVVALAGSSVLFGLAHFAGGIELVILATIAGACYGAIYLATGRLYMAIISHFLFNFYHLVFYTYPISSSIQ